MNSEQILKSDVIDIIFEHKNKAYGAYNLRRYYTTRMGKAIGAMLCMVLIFSALAFMPGKKNTDSPLTYETKIVTLADRDKKKEEPPKEKPRTKQAAAPQVKLLSTIRFTKNDAADTIRDITAVTSIGSTAITAPDSTGTEIPLGVTPGTGETEPAPVEPPTSDPVFDPSVPLENADVQPQFPGGMSRLYNFLRQHLNNPKDMEDGEEISVKVRFVVGYDGKLKSFETVQDGGPEFNREVIRVLKKMPDWIPGKSNGRNVSVYYTIPVKFTPAE